MLGLVGRRLREDEGRAGRDDEESGEGAGGTGPRSARPVERQRREDDPERRGDERQGDRAEAFGEEEREGEEDEAGDRERQPGGDRLREREARGAGDERRGDEEVGRLGPGEREDEAEERRRRPGPLPRLDGASRASRLGGEDGERGEEPGGDRRHDGGPRGRHERDGEGAEDPEELPREGAREGGDDRGEERDEGAGAREDVSPAAAAREADEEEGEERDRRSGGLRPGDDERPRHGEEDGAAGGTLARAGPSERPAQGERVLPVVLEGGAREVREGVLSRVVARRGADEGEVEAGEPRPLVDRQVGVVRQPVVDEGEERARHGARQARDRAADEPRVVGARLEEEARSARPARLEVDDGGDGTRAGGAREELRAEEAVLLAVVEEEEDRVPPGGGEEGTGRLEEDGDARGVVARAGAGADGVGVRREDDDGTSFCAREFREDVDEPGAGAVRRAGEAFVDLRGQAEAPDLGEEALAKGGVGRAPGRPRRSVGEKAREDLLRPPRRELRRRRVRPARVRRRGTPGGDGREGEEGEKGRGEAGGAHRTPRIAAGRLPRHGIAVRGPGERLPRREAPTPSRAPGAPSPRRGGRGARAS